VTIRLIFRPQPCQIRGDISALIRVLPSIMQLMFDDLF
jgi:hypothetical protein